LATAVWRPQACTGAAFRLLATYGRDRRLRRRRRVFGTRSLADPTIACTVAAASGSARRRLPRHHLRPQPGRRRQRAVVGHQVLTRRRHQRAVDPAAADDPPDASFELQLGDIVLRIPAGFDERELRRLLQALRC
jgi:hypothetical protein